MASQGQAVQRHGGRRSGWAGGVCAAGVRHQAGGADHPVVSRLPPTPSQALLPVWERGASRERCAVLLGGTAVGRHNQPNEGVQATVNSVRSCLAPAFSGRYSATFSDEKKGRVLVVIKTCLTKTPRF